VVRAQALTWGRRASAGDQDRQGGAIARRRRLLDRHHPAGHRPAERLHRDQAQRAAPFRQPGRWPIELDQRRMMG